jgi:hypothetical protein
MSISLYIPRMSSAFDDRSVRAVFDRLMIGAVTRVDFASITPGEHLSPNDRFQKAFIHLSHFYDTESANHLRSSLKTTQDSVRLYPDLFNRDVYWIVLLNKNPVAETKLNIHQVVENHRILEQIVFNQSATIMALEARLSQLVKYMNFPEEVERELLDCDDDMPELISVEDLTNSSTA